MQPILQMKGVSKSFGAVKALKDVGLSLYAHEVHAVMGENGAGKSTLMKILSGAYRPDAGSQILLDGKPLVINGPKEAKAAGIAIIYQELSLSPNLTVAENIFLGRETKRFGLLNRAEMEAEVRPLLERLRCSFSPRDRVGSLSIANQQLVEIARALMANSRILIMDEPTTTLSERETEGLFAMIRQLRAEGLAIVYISHRMNEVYELADRVSVLRDGAFAGELAKSQMSPETIVKLMVGRELASLYHKSAKAEPPPDAVVLRAEGLGDGQYIADCSFELRRGEVVGLAGLIGAGRSELAQILFGARPQKGGQIWLEGRPYQPRAPADAIAAGVAYVTEDRRSEGLFLDMSCEDNINMGVLRGDAFGGMVLNRKSARLRASGAISDLSVRVKNAKQAVGGLSGGNQQKILLSRWLQINPRVLILDEPTRGVDIGAKSEIYRIIDALAQRGMTILVISSELPEVLGIADRILVMHEGRICGELGGSSGREANQVNIMMLASGAAA